MIFYSLSPLASRLSFGSFKSLLADSIYRSIKVLLSLIVDVRDNENMTLVHLIADLNEPLVQYGNMTVLSIAVQNRLDRIVIMKRILISPLAYDIYADSVACEPWG